MKFITTIHIGNFIAWLFLICQYPLIVHAYEFYQSTEESDNPVILPTQQTDSIATEPIKEITAGSLTIMPGNGENSFEANNDLYNEYKKQFDEAFDEAIEQQKNIEIKTLMFTFDGQEKPSIYLATTVEDSEGNRITILKKQEGEKGPKEAVDKINSSNTNPNIINFSVSPSKNNSAQLIEIEVRGGKENKILSSVSGNVDMDLSQINTLLQPLINKNFINQNDVKGWLVLEISSMINNSITEKTIPLPNILKNSLYEGTGITTVIQSQKKANIALFSLIALDGEKSDIIADPDLGVEKALAYSREHPPQRSQLNQRRISSPYGEQIKRANNLVELTQILNQAGHGRGLNLDPNKLEEREWIYGSVDRRSPYYLGKLYKKEPTQEQLRTALHIKEWLRASGMNYIRNKLGLKTEQELANALDTRIQGINPDVARGLANYLDKRVSNPYCEFNGFCTNVDIQSNSVFVIRTTIQPSPQLIALILPVDQIYKFPQDSPAGFPWGFAALGGLLVGGLGGGGGVGGSSSPAPVPTPTPPESTPSPTPTESPTPSPTPTLTPTPTPTLTPTPTPTPTPSPTPTPPPTVPEPNSPMGLITASLLGLVLTFKQRKKV